MQVVLPKTKAYRAHKCATAMKCACKLIPERPSVRKIVARVAPARKALDPKGLNQCKPLSLNSTQFTSIELVHIMQFTSTQLKSTH